MKIYLIRHGDKPNIAGDPKLSELGTVQAKLTGEYLKDKQISFIYSSPLQRAKQTAEIIADSLKIKKIHFDQRLKERMNFGDNPNQDFEQFILEWNHTTNNREFKPSTGVSSLQNGTNIQQLIEGLYLKHSDTKILIVTHGGSIYDLLRNIFSDQYLKERKKDFLLSGIKNCSITILKKNSNNFILEEFDYIGHISDFFNNYCGTPS